MDWLDLLAVQGTLKSLLQHHSSKASILWHSAFFTVQLSHPYRVVCVCVCVTQSCLTLCNPMDCSPPGSFVRGILQARILQWVAISFSSHTGLGSCKSWSSHFHQMINIQLCLHACFSLKTPYLMSVVNALTLNSWPAAP